MRTPPSTRPTPRGSRSAWLGALLALAAWNSAAATARAQATPITEIAAPARRPDFALESSTPARAVMPWVDAGFDQLLARAKEEHKPVFVFVWADMCTTCERLEQVTYSSASVTTELSDFLCWRVDNRGPEARRMFERLGLKAASVPAQVFLTPEGRLWDALEVQFWSPQELTAEIRRIETGAGTIPRLVERVAADPDDLAARLELAIKSKTGGDKPAYEAELAEIRRRDPQGRSLASRRVALMDASVPLYDRFDDLPLREFLASETDPELLFLGWNRLASYQFFFHADKLRYQNDSAGALRVRASGLEAYRRAWPHHVAARPRDVVEWGNHFAWALWTERESIAEADRVLGLEVATTACRLAGDDADVIDTYGCLLYLAGRRDEALACLERCMQLEPLRSEWEERRVDFGLAEPDATEARRNERSGR